MIKGIIFDLDGTLTDSILGITDSINAGLKACGIDLISKEEAICYIGDGLEELILRSIAHSREALLTKNVKKEIFNTVKDIYMMEYKVNRIVKTKEFPCMTKVLMELKTRGYRLFVLSNKIQSDVGPMIDYFFPNIFDESLGECELIGKKPDVKGINYILNKYNFTKDEVLYVGDSHVDMETCQNAQIKSIVCNYGYERIYDLSQYNPTYYVDCPQDILKIDILNEGFKTV